jgi:hypothetical protein
VESQYWFHCLLFPNGRELTSQIVDEIIDTILFAISGECQICAPSLVEEFNNLFHIDSLTSNTSTAPYALSELEHMLTIATSIRSRFWCLSLDVILTEKLEISHRGLGSVCALSEFCLDDRLSKD